MSNIVLPRARAILLACFFLSGASGLAYEVIWLRMLGLVFGHTVHAITTVLAAFMTGLMLGSLIFSSKAGRMANPVRAYGVLEIGIGLSCALIPLALHLARPLYVTLHRVLNVSYDAFSLAQFLVVFVLLLVPTTLMGATLPVLAQALAASERNPGRAVGRLYAINTFGAVIGLASVGYVLLPALGNQTTSVIAAAVNILVGAVALALGR